MFLCGPTFGGAALLTVSVQNFISHLLRSREIVRNFATSILSIGTPSVQ